MDEDLNKEVAAYSLQNSSGALLSIQRLDFKTSFLEVVEELRMRREAEINYEKQMSTFVIEKQELEWQKEALQYQIETLNKQHTEALTAFKKQFQARIFAVEEEKGSYLLAEEAKAREIEGLKETLKMLQISKYTLQNKLNEVEQTLQMHMVAKEDHQRSLNEVEKCYAVITGQFGTIKRAHKRLEENVVEAIQLNKKLTAVNKRQESETDNLKEELKKVTADLIRCNVTCQHRAAEENLSLTSKEQEFQKLQQKISMETELKTKITEENEYLKKEKQEMITSLQHMQQLLCRQTEIHLRMEMELNELKGKYQTLERDNELQRQKAKENEEKFLNLQHEYEKAQATWKNAAAEMSTENEIHTSQKENKYAQTTSEVSNNLELEKMRVKNTAIRCLDYDEMHTEQNYADINAGEINLINTEDLDRFENCVNEDDMACLCKQNQRKASESETLSTLNFITPRLTSGSFVAEREKAAANKTEDNFLFDEIYARVEIQPPESCHPMIPVKERKTFPETLISKTNENINNALYEGSFMSQPLTKESKVQDNSASEKTTNNHSKTKTNSVILSQTVEHNSLNFYNDGLKQSSDISTSDINKAEKMSPIHSTDCLTSNIYLCNQINTYPEKIHIDDPCKNSNSCELSTTCNTTEKNPHLHASFCNSVDLNIHVTNDENTNNIHLEGNLNVNTEKLSKDININEMPSKELEDDNSRLPAMSTNRPKHTNEVLPLSTENVFECQAVELKMDQITTNKQKEYHASKTTCEQFLVVCDKETTLLKDNEESLCSTVTGEMTEEKNIEELCSLSIKTSGYLLNGNGKSSFDLPSEDKTVKIPTCLDLPKGCQGESQCASVSTSKAPFLLKEQLCTQEIKNNHSQKIGKNMNMNGPEKETAAPISINRLADTLNTGSINPGPKRNPTDEWNAIAKTFYEPYFPTEHVKTQCSSRLQQKSSQLAFEGSTLVLNESSHNSEEKEWTSQNAFIKRKLNNIENFLYLEKFCQPRKRKYKDNPEKAMMTNKAEM
ncbi:coiled-coil domain-containing protein 73 [Eublepharis macularius]|uniref:Coiled-coil domain-containing protein 73 n=1 Tax=Eublepharis macularius TaxID=481883 RepID=A0AA97IUR1_EUBMA|nr:coiled-coil domain-containing protein 73 [Eublepharis macularius]